jgi:hypothetical protein
MDDSEDLLARRRRMQGNKEFESSKILAAKIFTQLGLMIHKLFESLAELSILTIYCIISI